VTTIPDWAATPSADYRNIPGEFKGPSAPFSWQQLRLTSDLWINIFVGKVAIAFGGIQIAGWKPLDFLADWGQQRIDDALAAYQAAMIAQSSATFASSQVTILVGGALASDVTGGVALNAQFNEASATTLTGFTRGLSDGPGGGDLGPDGSGRAAWKKSGGLWRRHVDRHDTVLATDYQIVYVVMAEPVQAPSLGGDAYTYLIGRCDDAGTTFVFARIGNTDLAVGKVTAGSWPDPWETVEATTTRGDQWAFIIGTSTDDRKFIVKQNGITRLAFTDTSSSAMGASYRRVGVGALAAGRNLALSQTVPGELDLWAAADRQPTTV